MKFDLRFLQITFLASFLCYGIQYLDWDIEFYQAGIILCIALLTQSLFCLAYNLPIHTIKSAVITGLGISIILRTNHDFIYGLAGFFAIGSKYVLRIQNKHFINPANFGIIFMILFTNVVWISPAQWGSQALWIFILGSLGLMIMTNLRKIDLAISFIIFYLGIDIFYNVWYKGWPFDYVFHNWSNGSMILFTFFMITDPSSTPNSRSARIIWVGLIALLAFYFQAFMYIKGAPLYALFSLSILVPIFDYLTKESMFSWDSIKVRELYTNEMKAKQA